VDSHPHAGHGGIELVAAQDAEWANAPRQLVDAIAASTSPDELEAVLRASQSGAAATLLDARPAALVALASVPNDEAENPEADTIGGLAGTDVLLVGATWATLPAAVEHLGGRVTIVDEVYARVHAATLLRAATSRRGIHLEADARLPFADRTFATVYVDLSDVDALRDRAAVQRRLAEIARVAERGATIVIGLRHPVFAAIDRHAGAGRAERLRNAFRELRPRDLRAPWDPGLRRAGLRPRRLMVPARDSAVLPRLMAPAAARAALRDLAPRDARERIRRLAARAGVVAVLAPRAFVVAHPDGEPAMSLSERLVGEEPEIIPRETWRVALLGKHSFAKLALSAGQDQSVTKEIARTEAAAGSAFADVVPEGAMALRVGRAMAVRSPRIAGEPPAPAALGGVLAEILEPIPVSEYDSIGDTDLFSRVLRPPLPGNVAEARCDGLRELLLQRHREVRVPVGPTHGDLIVDNALLDAEGRAHVIDWIRFEERGPLFIDPLQAALSVHQRERGGDLAHAVAAFIDGEVAGPLATLADERSAGLDRAEASAWLLLHEVTALQNPVDAPSAERLRRVARVIEERMPPPPFQE